MDYKPRFLTSSSSTKPQKCPAPFVQELLLLIAVNSLSCVIPHSWNVSVVLRGRSTENLQVRKWIKTCQPWQSRACTLGPPCHHFLTQNAPKKVIMRWLCTNFLTFNKFSLSGKDRQICGFAYKVMPSQEFGAPALWVIGFIFSWSSY